MILGPRGTALVACGAPTPAWTPAGLPSLVFGDLALASVSGGRVASVGGLSQATGSLRPTFTASDAQFSGAPSAVFSGVEWLASGALAVPVGGWSLWAVARFDATASVRTVLDAGLGAWATFGILGLDAAGAVRYGSAGYASGPVIAGTGAHLISWTLRNGAAPNLDLWVDGVLVASGASSYGEPWSAYGLQLGRDHTPWPWPMRGAVSAFGLTSSPLSSGDQTALATWARSSRGTP